MQPLNKPFKPMAAATVEHFNQVRFPVLASPKIDGFRIVVRGGKAMTRNLLHFPNRHTQALFSHPAIDGVDGELVVGSPFGEGVFSRTSSGVTSLEGTPKAVLYAFDVVDIPTFYAERLHALRQLLRTVPHHIPIKLVEQDLLTTPAQLEAYIERQLAAGYEGVMLRDPDGMYKHGRSTLREHYLLKVKPFEDSEAIVLGVEEGVTNTNETGNAGRRRSLKSGLVPNGTLGGMYVRDVKSGVEFNLGCGTMRHTEAQALWNDRAKLIGQLAKYKYQKIGTVEKPRQPIFLGWRHPVDA